MKQVADRSNTVQQNRLASRRQASAGPDGMAFIPPDIMTPDIENTPAQTSPAPPVVQFMWPWSKKKKEDKYQGLSDSERRIAEFTDAIHQEESQHNRRQNVLGGTRYDYASQHDIESGRQRYADYQVQSRGAAQTPLIRSGIDKFGTATSAVAKAGTLATHLGQIVGNDTLGTTGRLTGGIGAGLGAVGSLLEAGLETHDIATSHAKKKDKAIKGVGVLGSLANAANSAASGVSQISNLVSGVSSTGSLAGIAAAVAAPSAIAKGGADVITGLATGGLAHYRSNRLEEIEERGDMQGIARFAKENQWNKAKSNYGKALGGALGVLGGAVLLAAGLSNPVGWGLLAAGGLVGLGIAAYKMYKKHRQGREILDNPGYRDALYRNQINVPDDEELGPGGWKDIFKTKSMRRQELVRGMIAMRLAKGDQDGTLGEIGGYLGVKRPDAQGLPLLSDERDAEMLKRAKSYAKALDY
jgi:hypothetical protein